MMRLLLSGLFLEIGGVLLIAPWSRFWERNYFLELLPQLEPLLTSPYVRGAVSGLGVVNLAAGIVELAALIVATRASSPREPASRVAGE
jgi:hypothetical protein